MTPKFDPHNLPRAMLRNLSGNLPRDLSRELSRELPLSCNRMKTNRFGQFLATGSPLLLMLVLVSGCTIFGNNAPKEIDDLEQARASWSALGWSDYDIDMVRGCFCAGAGSMTVLVRSDSVAAVIPIDSYWRSDPSWWQWIPTVDDLFEEIERASIEASTLEVSYTADGWPQLVSIDWIAQAVDDEISYSISDVQPAGSDVVPLAIDESIVVGTHEIRLDAVTEDSRCPYNVECIWAGRAIIQLTVTSANGSQRSAVLIDGAQLEGESDTVTIDGLTIRLLLVTPYPEEAGVAISDTDYRAWLVVGDE